MNFIYVHMLVIYLPIEYSFTIFNIFHLYWFVLLVFFFFFLTELRFISNNTEN